MNIAEYLAHMKISPEALGEQIGVHGVTVRRWMAGAEIKTGDVVRLIKASGKLITCEALLKSNGKRAA